MERQDDLYRDLASVMITRTQISEKVAELGARISRDYAGKNLLMISVLKGSVVFMADLMRAVTIPARIDFMAVSSYGSGTKSSGVVKIIKDIDIELAGKDLLIVEDILDSGMTLQYLKELLSGRGPASIRVVTLCDKPSRRDEQGHFQSPRQQGRRFPHHLGAEIKSHNLYLYAFKPSGAFMLGGESCISVCC